MCSANSFFLYPWTKWTIVFFHIVHWISLISSIKWIQLEPVKHERRLPKACVSHSGYCWTWNQRFPLGITSFVTIIYTIFPDLTEWGSRRKTRLGTWYHYLVMCDKWNEWHALLWRHRIPKTTVQIRLLENNRNSQRARIFMGNCCLKVHNAHLKLASPISG